MKKGDWLQVFLVPVTLFSKTDEHLEHLGHLRRFHGENARFQDAQVGHLTENLDILEIPWRQNAVHI